MEKLDIKSLYLEELEAKLQVLKEPKFRAKQVFDWIHNKKVRSYEVMKNLPVSLRDKLSGLEPLTIVKKVNAFHDDSDGTIKYLFELYDGEIVETVLMKYKYGYSVCISSQVGCKMGCTFCASTIGGLKRQLLASEMLDQIYAIEVEQNIAIHSVVVMGTGEPFDNYDQLIRFIGLISHEKGRHLSRRSITVSTCGIVENIIKLSIDAPQVNLAISLHSPYQDERKKVMPVAARYPLDQLMDACKQYAGTTNRRITFEYSMIRNINDSLQNAEDLGKLLSGILCHVNLIPVNPVDERDYQAAGIDRIKAFKEVLEAYHIPTTIRRSLGQNIDAACGQLRNRHMKEKK